MICREPELDLFKSSYKVMFPASMEQFMKHQVCITIITHVVIKTLIKNKCGIKCALRRCRRHFNLNPVPTKRRPLSFFFRKTVLFTLIKWSISSWLVMWESWLHRRETWRLTAVVLSVILSYLLVHCVLRIYDLSLTFLKQNVNPHL